MTGFSRPGVRARPDWSFVALGGPGCRWEGPDLTFLGFALGGIHPPADPWLVDLKALSGALQEVYGPRFALGDRDLLLQRAVDAKAEGHRRLAEILAAMIRFPPLDVLRKLSDDGHAQSVRTAIADQRRVVIRRQEDDIRSNARYSDTQKRRRLRQLTGWDARIRRFE